MTDAFHAFGAALTFDSDPVGEVGDISGPNISVGEEEVTHHGSPDEWKEFLPGLKDPGSITFSGNFTDTSMAAMQTKLDNRTVAPVVLTLANDSTWQCDGLITSIDTDTPVEGKEGYSMTFRLTGKPTFTANDPRYTVIFNETAPVADATIVFYSSTKLTNANGVAIFAGIPDGTHAYTASESTLSDAGNVTVAGADKIKAFTLT